MNKKPLRIVCGPPCSGKTRYITEWCAKKGKKPYFLSTPIDQNTLKNLPSDKDTVLVFSEFNNTRSQAEWVLCMVDVGFMVRKPFKKEPEQVGPFEVLVECQVFPTCLIKGGLYITMIVF